MNVSYQFHIQFDEIGSDFWSSFVHVVRNSVDHGLESAEDRLMQGKSEAGTLEISTQLDGDEFVIAISDDGRGISWESVAAAARKKNLPADSREHLEEALFADGLTTTEHATATSGRGVGMGAVRASCHQLDGRIEIAQPSPQPNQSSGLPLRAAQLSPKHACPV